MSISFDGPWMMPDADDMFDGREFYAAKTVTNGNKRYLVGWQAVRKDCSDDQKFVWGGNVLVHELVQRPDGTLGVQLVEIIEVSFQKELPMELSEKQGVWSESKAIYGEAQDGFGWAEIGKLQDPSFFSFAELKNQRDATLFNAVKSKVSQNRESSYILPQIRICFFHMMPQRQKNSAFPINNPNSNNNMILIFL